MAIADDVMADLQSTYTQQNKLPPVAQWNPPLSGDMDLLICRDGTWLHEGSPIKRPALVRLFASILKREGEDYFLVTPVEKWRIKLEDAPFLIQAMHLEKEADSTIIVVEDNMGIKTLINAEHPLRVTHDPITQEPSPYVMIRDGLEALVNRNVFYEMVELAFEDEAGQFWLSSAGENYRLG